MRDSIQFGSRQIEFNLQFSERKSLGITVTPEMRVLVKAPSDARLEKIKEKVKKKAPWIIRQQNFFLSFEPRTPERRYVGGETHLYLGRQYRLKIFRGKENEVKLRGRFIEVITTDKQKVKEPVKNWYLQQARTKFKLYSRKWIEQFKKYHVEPKGLVIREMPTRWGSCTPKNKIILNPELVKAPKGCIEYVIVHELCHLVHRHHTQKFIELQTKEMKDWEKWKMKLERLMA
jgi:predicted metal-dependent hydrolase